MFGKTQKPWDAISRVGLNLLRMFSIAIPAVSSTIWASSKVLRSASKSASSTWASVRVMRSAYSRARRSSSPKRSDSRQSASAAIFSAPFSSSYAPYELMSSQNGQPLIAATRAFTRAWSAGGIRPDS